MSIRGKPERVFAAFTEEVNAWWRRGPRYRNSPDDQGIICLEPKLGGRVFESHGNGATETVVEIGRITRWDPPHTLCFTWRLANFLRSENTEVEITFDGNGSNTTVTVVHRGWEQIRGDHPARHGEVTRKFLGRLGLWWVDQLRSLELTLDRNGEGR